MKLKELNGVLAGGSSKVLIDLYKQNGESEEGIKMTLTEAYKQYGTKDVCVIHQASIASYDNVDYLITLYK